MADGFAKVRDGILEHHKDMTFPEIAVFSRLLSVANRTARRGRIGLCIGVGTRTLASDMGKSRESIKRAVRGLQDKGYIERVFNGILVLNFNGAEPRKHPRTKKPPRTTRESGLRGSPPPDYERVPPRTTRESTSGLRGSPPALGLNRSLETVDVVDGGDGTPAEDIFRWDSGSMKFIGDRTPIRERVQQLGYYDEFGADWIKRTWNACVDWCVANPAEIRAKRDYKRFVLNWYRRDANAERRRA